MEFTFEILKNKYQEVVARLPQYLDLGFVVSKDANGAFDCQGDSLLFSGMALYALSQKDGQPIADALVKMLQDCNGGAYRHPDFEHKDVPLDGLLGLYRGLTKRVNLCGEKDLWAPLMKNHKARVQSSLPLDFALVCDMLLYKLGISEKPNMKRAAGLIDQIAGWTANTIARRASCYRIHLGLVALQTLEALGEPLPLDGFREMTGCLKMPAIDHYVGRPGLYDWLHGFKYDVWQYAHQRCPIWEVPDALGMSHPGIDYLVGFADLYGSPK